MFLFFLIIDTIITSSESSSSSRLEFRFDCDALNSASTSSMDIVTGAEEMDAEERRDEDEDVE